MLPPLSSAPTAAASTPAASFDNPDEALALSALRFRARQASATFLSRSIDESLVFGGPKEKEEEVGEEAEHDAAAAGGARRATGAATNPSWADAVRDALARDARRRRLEASEASKRAHRAVSARFSVSRGGGRGGGRGRGRGRGRGVAASATKPAAAAFARTPAAAAAPSTAPKLLPRGDSPFPEAAGILEASAATINPPPRGRKRSRREAEEADKKYRAAVAAANASAAAANAGVGSGGALLSFPAPLGSPPARGTSLHPPRVTAPAAPERFVHPLRWPPKTGSLRESGAARLAPVAEAVTPRRLRPAPWGISPGRQSGDRAHEGETEYVPEASGSVLHVAPSPSASPSAVPPPPSASSCFPRTVIRRSRIAGLGLYALARISRGSAVAEYSGELVRAPLADMREVDYARLGLGERRTLLSFRVFESFKLFVFVRGRCRRRTRETKNSPFPFSLCLPLSVPARNSQEQASTSSESGPSAGAAEAAAERTSSPGADAKSTASDAPLPPLLLLLLHPAAVRRSSSTRR